MRNILLQRLRSRTRLKPHRSQGRKPPGAGTNAEPVPLKGMPGAAGGSARATGLAALFMNFADRWPRKTMAHCSAEHL
jgi:hypothetical protein